MEIKGKLRYRLKDRLRYRSSDQAAYRFIDWWYFYFILINSKYKGLLKRMYKYYTDKFIYITFTGIKSL